MNRRDLIVAVSDRTGISRVRVSQVLDAVLETIMDEVSAGSRVFLQGFGKFIPKHREAKVYHHIASDSLRTRPATDVPVFAPGKVFENRVKEARQHGSESEH